MLHGFQSRATRWNTFLAVFVGFVKKFIPARSFVRGTTAAGTPRGTTARILTDIE